MIRKPDGTPIKILCVCGWGIGSSMMLKFLIEEVAKSMNLDIEIEHTDYTSAQAMAEQFDIIAGQEMHVEIFQNQVSAVVVIRNFVDRDPIRQQLEENLKRLGWME